jgi:hypothetical protein
MNTAEIILTVIYVLVIAALYIWYFAVGIKLFRERPLFSVGFFLVTAISLAMLIWFDVSGQNAGNLTPSPPPCTPLSSCQVTINGSPSG